MIHLGPEVYSAMAGWWLLGARSSEGWTCCHVVADQPAGSRQPAAIQWCWKWLFGWQQLPVLFPNYYKMVRSTGQEGPIYLASGIQWKTCLELVLKHLQVVDLLQSPVLLSSNKHKNGISYPRGLSWQGSYTFSKQNNNQFTVWAGEMDQWLRAQTALAHDWSSEPSIHVVWLTTVYNLCSRGSDALFWILMTPALTCAQTHTQIHTHINKNKIYL